MASAWHFEGGGGSCKRTCTMFYPLTSESRVFKFLKQNIRSVLVCDKYLKANYCKQHCQVYFHHVASHN